MREPVFSSSDGTAQMRRTLVATEAGACEQTCGAHRGAHSGATLRASNTTRLTLADCQLLFRLCALLLMLLLVKLRCCLTRVNLTVERAGQNIQCLNLRSRENLCPQ